MKKREWIQTILTTVIILGVTTVLYLYTSGYRLDDNGALGKNNEIQFKKTGMIGAKSIPDGAKVYLDGILVTATNDTIPSVDPGEHKLKISKNGYVTWEKMIEVFPELVTDITAVLVTESTSFAPLTNTGAHGPSISPSLSKIAFFSKDGTNPGVWVIPFYGNPGGISLFKSNPYVVLEDTFYNIYSNGDSIEWSPDEEELLITDIKDNQNTYFVVDLNTKVAQATSSPDTVKKNWLSQLLKDRVDFLEKLDIPEDIKKIATDSKTLWAPDEKKFMYIKEEGDNLEYKVYNMEKPIPVGENVETTVFVTNKNEKQPSVSWYADSFHLILTDYDDEKKQGVISLIRIDGTNKTEVYSNTLYSDKVFSTPNGDKLIILTSFKSDSPTNLYTVGIR